MADESKAARADLSALRIDRNRPSGGGWKILVVLGVLAAAGAFLFWRLGPTMRVPEVEVGIVRLAGSTEGSALLSAGGYLLPDRKANVSSKTFGRLEWIGVDVGSKVKKDEVIAKLASADLAARLEEAKAGL